MCTAKESTQPKVFGYKKTGFFRKNPVFLKTLHPKIYVALLRDMENADIPFIKKLSFMDKVNL